MILTFSKQNTKYWILHFLNSVQYNFFLIRSKSVNYRQLYYEKAQCVLPQELIAAKRKVPDMYAIIPIRIKCIKKKFWYIFFQKSLFKEIWNHVTKNELSLISFKIIDIIIHNFFKMMDSEIISSKHTFDLFSSSCIN